MGLLIESTCSEIVLCIVLLLVLYFRYKHSYWVRKKVPILSPLFFFGDVKDIILRRKTLGVVIKDIYDKFRLNGRKYGGFYVFTKPVFMAVDPEIIKMVMTKDFGTFHDRGVYYNEEVDPLSAHLFAIEGQKWRSLRTKLSPTFTSGKMKMMFQNLVECSRELEVILGDVGQTNEGVDVKDIAARFTTDIISSCAFGLECNSLKNPESEFRKYGKKFFEPSFLEAVKLNLQFISPGVLKALKTTIVPTALSNFFLDAIKQTVEYRESRNIDRKDMMNLLIRLKNHQSLDGDGKTEEGITFEELAAQCLVFFLAGFETSSSTMTFALYELSQNHEIQTKLREEVHKVLLKHSGEMSYEAIMEMTYMDKVINETLRMYPPVPILNRVANEPWKIPETDILLEKGTKVFISSFGLHRDPEYYPNPDVFDPERFSDECKAKRHTYCFLPFGEGPRNCIGMRFGMLQAKVGLAVFLKDHKFEMHPKTKPLQFDVSGIILTHKDGIWLRVMKV